MAYKNGRFYAFEVKNRKAYLKMEEYEKHLKRCRKVGINPAFIVSHASEEVKEQAERDRVPIIITNAQYVQYTTQNRNIVESAKKNLGDKFYKLIRKEQTPRILVDLIREEIW